MKRDYDKFYEKEQPELVTVKGGKLRLYKEGQRLGVQQNIHQVVFRRSIRHIRKSCWNCLIVGLDCGIDNTVI